MALSANFPYVIAGVLILYALFLYLGKLPPMESIQRLATMLDTKGGNIIVLVALALYFFHSANVFYYSVLDKIHDGTIASDNGIALNGLTFATGAFSGIIGALLKVMSGTEAPAPPGTSTTVNKVTTSATTESPVRDEATTTATEVKP